MGRRVDGREEAPPLGKVSGARERRDDDEEEDTSVGGGQTRADTEYTRDAMSPGEGEDWALPSRRSASTRRTRSSARERVDKSNELLSGCIRPCLNSTNATSLVSSVSVGSAGEVLVQLIGNGKRPAPSSSGPRKRPCTAKTIAGRRTTSIRARPNDDGQRKEKTRLRSERDSAFNGLSELSRCRVIPRPGTRRD